MKERLIQAVVKKLEALSEANVRKVLTMATTLLNIQEERNA